MFKIRFSVCVLLKINIINCKKNKFKCKNKIFKQQIKKMKHREMMMFVIFVTYTTLFSIL